MSRNGSGTYNLPAGNPVVTGNTISSSWANTTLSDIASALTGSIAADGQTTPTANLVMGTYAHTGVGNATARTMYASAGQVQDSVLTYLTSVAGTNAITASAPIVMTAYATGQTFRFIAAGASTGAVTININSIGLKSVVRTDGTALVSGDIASGAAVQIMYDGTNFQLLSDANGKSETFTAITTGSLTDTGLTSGRVTYASTGGLLADSANLTFNGTTLTSTKFAGALNGSLGATTPSTVVATTISGTDLTTTGNTILGNASTDTLNVGNGDLIKDASGNVLIGSASNAGAAKLLISNNGAEGVEINPSSSANVSATQYYNRSGAAYIKNLQVASAYSWNLSGAASDAMTLNATGDLLIGTTDRGDTTGNGIKMWENGGIPRLSMVGNTTSTGQYPIMIRASSNNTWRMYIDWGGNIYAQNTAITSLSDIRLKENIRDLETGLPAILALKPRRFDWKEGKGQDKKDVAGFIAQEFEEILPEMVTTGMDEDESGDKYKMLAPSMLIPTLVKAMQEQQAMIDELKAKVAALEAK
jgi:hypothetical protein